MISSVSSSSDGMLSLSKLQEKMFLKADSNGDGQIDSSEMSAIQAGAPQGGTNSEDVFTELDTDQDGSISRAESDAAIAKMFYEMSQDGPALASATLAAGSTAAGGVSEDWADLFSKIDTDGDGTVTQEEFVSNRPDDMSEEQATAMWDQLDISESGSLTESQFVSALASQAPPPGPPPGPPPTESADTMDDASATTSTSASTTANGELLQALLTAISNYVSTLEQGGSASSDTSTSTSPSSSSTEANQRFTELFNKIDTDGDGTVTQEEFLANRPDEISEEQATQTWNQLDTSESGSLTESQFVTAMASQAPPPGPPPGPPPNALGTEEDSSLASSESTSATATSATSTTTSSANSDLVQALMTAINKYLSTMEQNSDADAALSTAAGSLSIEV